MIYYNLRRRPHRFSKSVESQAIIKERQELGSDRSIYYLWLFAILAGLIICMNITMSPDKTLAAVCGLFCPACGLYIGTHHDPQRLQRLADQRQVAVEELTCDGCRAERRTAYCKSCKLIACATEKGLDFCGACADYPCDQLKEFQAARPHRLELWQSQARIKEVGYEQWFEEMLAHYACPQCQTINSAYDATCWSCGATPSCAYVSEHQQEIQQFMAK